MLNVLFVGGTVAALRYARLPVGVVVALALNPAIWFEGVANPHLEVWGLAFIAATFAFAARSAPGGWLASGTLALAGAVKLPYLVLGGAGIAAIAPLRRRCGILVLGTLLALLVSWRFAGASYFLTVPHFAEHRVALVRGWSQYVRVGALLVAVAASAAGFFRGRNYAGMAWLAPQLAPLPFPWYSSWGLAYTLERSRWMLLLLVTLPLFDVFMDYNYDLHSIGWIFPVACLVAVIWDITRRGRPQRAERAAGG